MYLNVISPPCIEIRNSSLTNQERRWRGWFWGEMNRINMSNMTNVTKMTKIPASTRIGGGEGGLGVKGSGHRPPWKGGEEDTVLSDDIFFGILCAFERLPFCWCGCHHWFLQRDFSLCLMFVYLRISVVGYIKPSWLEDTAT